MPARNSKGRVFALLCFCVCFVFLIYSLVAKPRLVWNLASCCLRHPNVKPVPICLVLTSAPLFPFRYLRYSCDCSCLSIPVRWSRLGTSMHCLQWFFFFFFFYEMFHIYLYCLGHSRCSKPNKNYWYLKSINDKIDLSNFLLSHLSMIKTVLFVRNDRISIFQLWR